MAARLRSIYQATDWRLDATKPRERVAYYRKLLLTGLQPSQAAVVPLQLAKELIQAGENDAAVHELESLRSDWQPPHAPLSPEFARKLGAQLALSYLRLGEQENCAAMHGQHSCIFPLRADGVHMLPRGATGAVRELTALLSTSPPETPGNALARWLFNVAYMQLGQYPASVPPQWLMPAERFASDQPFPDFPDIAAAAGLTAMSHAGGAIMEGFNGDGLLDIMVSSSAPDEQMCLYLNNGDGTFRDATREAGLAGETGGLNLVLTDYDNDGHPDVLVLRGGWWGAQGAYPMSLLRNRGDGTFEDVTVAAGLLSAQSTQTAAWADYDNDGWLDLFVGHESKPGDPHPSQLFHNNHDGTFTEVGAASGLSDLGFVKGVAWGDYNNDGRPDLYVSVMYGHNRLFRNDGPGDPRNDGPSPNGAWKFTDVTAEAHVSEQTNSLATWFFDYDNDGWPDIFVAGYSTHSTDDVGAFQAGHPFHAELPRLYHNNHDGTFTDQSRAVHLDRAILPMGANFGDLDNDGWLDIYLGTGSSEYEALMPNRMFRNVEGHAFADVTTAGGFGNLQKATPTRLATSKARALKICLKRWEEPCPATAM
jgi:hypothetical protein